MADQDKNSKNQNPNEEVNADSKASQDTNNVSDIKAKKNELNEHEEALSKMRNDYLYLKAEFENFKKNNIKERSEILKYAGERIAFDLLVVLDIFDKALEAEVTKENWPAFVDGVKLTSKELKSTLEKHGVKEIESYKKDFDPRYHDAMTMVPTADASPNTIIEVFRKGYLIHDKVLRPSQVVVAKGPDA